jgi:hypothetical protein
MTKSMKNEDQPEFQPVSVYEGVAGKRSALLDRRAVCDQRKFREASLAEQTGWWFNHKKKNSP